MVEYIIMRFLNELEKKRKKSSNVLNKHLDADESIPLTDIEEEFKIYKVSTQKADKENRTKLFVVRVLCMHTLE